MTRPRKRRNVSAKPGSVVYKPAGVPVRQLEWTILNLDEFEAIRLIDYEKLDQERAAEAMGVSRPTVTRIYRSAREKIAHVLVSGQALRIEGGPVEYVDPPANAPGRGRGRGRRQRRRRGRRGR